MVCTVDRPRITGVALNASTLEEGPVCSACTPKFERCDEAF